MHANPLPSPAPAPWGAPREALREARTVVDLGAQPAPAVRVRVPSPAAVLMPEPTAAPEPGARSWSGAISGALSRLLGRPVQLVIHCANADEAAALHANFEVVRRWLASGGAPANAAVRLILQRVGITSGSALELGGCPQPGEIVREGSRIVLPAMPRRDRAFWKTIALACGEATVFERGAEAVARRPVTTGGDAPARTGGRAWLLVLFGALLGAGALAAALSWLR
ncbi:MAG: hypothetical protein D6776_02220 [Planctomycetota bacterium]|nr:MAG: hypothetical protein D6776_02220 [Planctomycetota bacterium]